MKMICMMYEVEGVGVLLSEECPHPVLDSLRVCKDVRA